MTTNILQKSMGNSDKRVIYQMNAAQSGMISALLYFDIFNYPLTKDEIRLFMSNKQNGSFDSDLDELVDLGYIHRYQNTEYYSVNADNNTVSKRNAGNQLANKKMKLARRVSRFISYFPFVRSVMLSGSISKGYMQPDSDIDFFIVTKPGGLWLARTALVMFKRIFLFNSHKFFCVNYFIDTEHLEIEEKNIFTAIECATLIPTFGQDYYKKFWKANSWVAIFLPNKTIRPVNNVPKSTGNLFKKVVEKLLSNKLGNALDKLFMELTLKRWHSKFKKDYDSKDFEIAFKSTRNTSKNHPNFFQKKVLDALDAKLKVYEVEKQVNLTS